MAKRLGVRTERDLVEVPEGRGRVIRIDPVVEPGVLEKLFQRRALRAAVSLWAVLLPSYVSAQEARDSSAASARTFRPGNGAVLTGPSADSRIF
ncbi:MAG: hypothetical protein LC753_16830 [Acidobacteria bacterium]|nr:hypothetical protein [Acidobacteriota bacterium]MCA1651855.1 hypothetical protein [Acidobacteriota bacterium]